MFRRLFAAALLLPLIAFATATSAFELRCRITGAVLDDCCCGDADQSRPPPATTTISQADCCDRLERHVAPSFAELTAPETATPVRAVFPLPFEAASIDLVSARASVRATARSSLGPPTARLRLIAKSTLLI
jgi:hypothetical protein